MRLFSITSARHVALLLALSLPFSVVPIPVQAQTAHLKQGPDGRLIPDLNVGMSPEQQIKLGQQAAAEARKQLPMLPDDSPITRYVSQLGHKLAAQAPGYKWPFEFHVVNQKEINAFALPGGPVFVNLGTIQKADEGELAGVMAHEISHVVMQHSAREAGKQQGIGVIGALGSVLAGAVLGNGVGGSLAQLGIQMGASGLVTRYSRTAETEADLMGAQIMYDAGFNPGSMVEFFDTLKQEGGQGVPEFLSDHPDPGNRAQNVQKVISRFPRKTYPRTDSPEFVAMHQEAMKMHPYTAQEIAKQQKSGHVANTNMTSASVEDRVPSRTMKSFSGSGVQLSYPDNWHLFNSDGKAVVIAPPSGVSQDAIAYGLHMQRIQPGQKNVSLDDRTTNIVNTLVRSNPDMKAVGSAQRIRVNGLQGRSVDLVSTSPLQDQSGSPLQERDWLVTVDDGSGGTVMLIFIAPDKEFSSLRPTFENILRSVQVQ
ncbi:MAG TPA: M48 family metalloprotease [Candidatus Acidoferrales bacterium]|nr:M48 family metalloprotease [Candidatus Acidoferrales bacterium]